MKKKLHPVGLKNRETLLKLKEKEHAEKGYPFDGEFYIWDYRYYDQRFIQTSLDLDEMLVKEYFPVSVIVPQIIQIYQNLLSIKFVEMKGDTWHPGDVPAFVFHLPKMLTTSHRGPEVFRLEEGCQIPRGFHWVLLPRFVPKE